ncbi:MAG TPA: hypothetical protein VMV77_04600 [Bacteroidales bacterium]|nr:hypothetical protein [Bacteroidales bacterium]
MENVKEIKFNEEKASAYLKVSNEFISGIKIKIGEANEMDMIYEQLTITIDAIFYSALVEDKILTYYCPRPKFFDWLFRRCKKVEWNLKVKDVLLNPPKPITNTKRIYITELKED